MIFYRDLKLDRASELRKNSKWLEKQWARQQCRVFILRDNKNLMRWPGRITQKPEVIHFHKSEIKALADSPEQMIFLGLDHSGPLFALDVSSHDTTLVQPYTDDHEFVDIRDLGCLLDAQQAAQLAYARGLVFWNRQNRFCGACGSAAKSQQGGHARQCTNESCARIHFPRTDPAVIMLVEDCSNPDKPRCLLARNSRFPSRMMSTLAGFVDPLESLEETVAREVREECGIEVEQVSYQASQPWPFPSSIMLGFRARAKTFEINVDGDEIEEAYWFGPDQLRSFGEWGDGGDNFSLPRRDSIARYLVESWIEDVSM